MNTVSKNKIGESESRSDKERTVLYNSFMNAPAGIAILKGDTHIYEFANAEYEKLVDRKIIIGKTVQELFPEIEQQGIIDILNNVFSTGEPFIANEFPVELINERTGKLVLHYYNSVIQPLKDEKGNTERLLSHGVEVTQQVEARKQIEASEKRFGAAVEAIQGILWTNNANGEMEGEQKGWAALTGQSYEEYHGYGWATAVHPDDAQPTIDAWNEAVKQSKTFVFEHRVKTKSGKWELFAIKAIPLLNEDGSIREWVGVHTNITEQKKAEEKLKESEAKFRMLSETVPHMVWTATPDGNKNFFNKYYLDYTGKTFEELKGEGWHSIIFPDDLKKELGLWHSSLRTREDFRIEKRIRHFDGTYRWHLSHSIAQKDKEGKIIGWIGTNTEIEGQKKFAEELEQKVKERTYQLHIQNETFKQAEESSMQGSYSFNLTTGKLAYSDNLYRLIGYEPNEFDPSLEEFNKHVHPDDKDYVTLAAQKVIQSKTADEWHYRMTTKNGTVINIKGTGRVIESGEEKLLVGTLQDISKDVVAAGALIEKEDYLNQIISNAPDAVIVINEKNIITLWNPKTEEIFGWKAEEVLGFNLSDIIIPTQYREGHREGMKRLLKTGEPRILGKTLELTALNKEGKEFPISLTVSQAVQQGDKLFISFIRDTTLEKQNKEELKFKSKQLEEINQTLELKNKELENTNVELASFSYIASHDLKEPLRKIQAFSNRIIETENFSDKTKDYFNRIVSAAKRMQNLIDSLLDFSYVNSTELIFEPCDLNSLVEESKNDLHISIIEKEATIEHENLPVIMGVCIQISQLITNLLDNAIKYSQPGIKPRIKITSSIIEGKLIEHTSANKKTKYHAIQFADNGIGFEQEYAKKIFELFQRLHGKNEYSGTGIGLGIVKKIVAYHNGFITAQGKPNIGSTFIIYIPTS
jgi:PAS domain S-box-containing protein